jgi:hypothetical protein
MEDPGKKTLPSIIPDISRKYKAHQPGGVSYIMARMSKLGRPIFVRIA